MPKIVYSVTGNTVSLRLRIEQAGKTVEQEQLNLSSEDKGALAIAVAQELLAMAGQVPMQGATQ